MAKQETSPNEIPNLETDWGMDVENGLPYSGDAVQKFVKKYLSQISEISEQLWPVTLSFSVSSGLESRTISYTLTQKGETLIPDTVEITKKVNGGEGVLLEGTVSQVEGNIESFSIRVVKGTVTKTSSVTKYIALSGSSAVSEASQELIDSLTKKEISSATSFSPTVTTGDGEYMWVAIPSSLSISQIKDKNTGFGIDLAPVQTFTESNGNSWKLYRTDGTLLAASWTLQLI